MLLNYVKNIIKNLNIGFNFLILYTMKILYKIILFIINYEKHI